MKCVLRHLAARGVLTLRTHCSFSFIRHAVAVSRPCFRSSAKAYNWIACMLHQPIRLAPFSMNCWNLHKGAATLGRCRPAKTAHRGSWGFTVAERAARVCDLLPAGSLAYTPRHASYDLSNLRGKALVERINNTQRYRTPPAGIRILAGMLILREQVVKPVLAGLGTPRVGRPPKKIEPIDQYYDNLQRELRRTFETLALAA